MRVSAVTLERWNRFRGNRRAWWSLWLLVVAYVLSLLSPWLVNDRPLALHYAGEWSFPAFFFYPESHFGGTYQTEPDYPAMLAHAREDGIHFWALMPPVPQDPLRARLDDAGSPPYAPSREHWLGTDAHGRDLLSRLIHGFRICMSFSLLLTLLSTFLGIAVGAIQGYLGGRVDIFAQRGIEIWASLPFLYVVILVASLYGSSFWLLLGIMTLFSWVGLSYYMRGEFLRLRDVTYVKAAKTLGFGWAHILFREMLPNALTPVVTLFPFALIGGIGSLTSLDFLGFGLAPPTPSWGDLMAQGLENLYAPWIAVSATAALFFTLLLATFVGEGVRDAMDPKSGDRFC
ncbi:MAG TPA: ABC transporter permease [Fibrobacteraceae bacterium]|nr:ABC transporter permease [Fibrobacteraceae bacterium]